MGLMAIGKIFFSDFGLFYQVPMNSGALYGVTQTIDTFVYRMGLEQAQFSLSTAVGLFKSVIGLVLIVISRWVAYKTLDYRIF